MKAKRIIASILAAASLAALTAFPSFGATASSGAVSTFSDVRDPALGEAIEALRIMGVIDGMPGGAYEPSGTLTRAEFCKLAVMIMGRGGDVDAYATKTIYPDVSSTHWARGYINLASSITVGSGEEGSASGGSRLIMGVGDGTFAPNRAITCAEAVTILLRLLSYSEAANTNWPSGAMSTANSLGLTEGLPALTASAAITRGQAALLFYNMLLTSPKGSSAIYAASLGSAEPGVILLDCDAETAAGVSGAVQVSGKEAVLAAVNSPASFFQGKSGTAVYDHSGLFLTFLPDRGASNTAVVSNGASASGLTLSNGTFLSLSASTPVWRNGEKTTYGEIWASLDRSGVSLMVYYTAAGAVDYLYVNTSASSGGAMVNYGESAGNPFLSLVGGDTGYVIYKNGSRATSADIEQYDVATYDPATRSLIVSDLRLSGIYEAAEPNVSVPTKITLMGAQFDVLESAWDSLRNFQIGSAVTLLFTADGMVAGAVSPAECRANAIGIASIDGSTATVTLLDSVLPKLSGTFTGGNVGSYDGQLVSVTYGSNGTLSMSKLTSSSIPGALDVADRTLGSRQLADNVHIYDRVGRSPVVEVALTDIPFLTVPAGDISYARTNYAGKVDLIVLDDVTGDAYQYGIVSVSSTTTTASEPDKDDEDEDPFAPAPGTQTTTYTITFRNSHGSFTITSGAPQYAGGSFMGWAAATSADGSQSTLAGTVELKATVGFTRQAIDTESGSITAGGLTLPIASDVQCYSKRTGRWFSSLDELMASSNSFTAYYDRSPDEGGKARVIVAN